MKSQQHPSVVRVGMVEGGQEEVAKELFGDADLVPATCSSCGLEGFSDSVTVIRAMKTQPDAKVEYGCFDCMTKTKNVIALTSDLLDDMVEVYKHEPQIAQGMLLLILNSSGIEFMDEVPDDHEALGLVVQAFLDAMYKKLSNREKNDVPEMAVFITELVSSLYEKKQYKSAVKIIAPKGDSK